MTFAPLQLDPKQFGKVAVLVGGKSAEREISLLSGKAVLAALKRQGVDAHAVDAADDLLKQLESGGFDRAFNVLHGRGGEDGQVQGALAWLDLPLTGSGVMASALAMDKHRTKQLWRAAGLPTAKAVLLKQEVDLADAQALGFPLMIKPSHEGSSIGMARVESPEQLRQAWLAAAQFDAEVLAEQWIDGDEYTLAILGDQALPIIKLETPNAFYDYNAKYQANDTRYLIPCGLPEATEKAFQDLALEAFRVLGACGWGRIDLMTDAKGQAQLLELNTVPGMTDHSLVPMAAKAEGIDFDQLVLRILAQTLEATDEARV